MIYADSRWSAKLQAINVRIIRRWMDNTRKTDVNIETRFIYYTLSVQSSLKSGVHSVRPLKRAGRVSGVFFILF
jgi:hypothetical protein